MINNVLRVHLDRPATQAKILSMAQSKGFSVQQYNRAVRDFSARYRQASRKTRLSEIDKYVVIAQVLDVRLDELFIVTDK